MARIETGPIDARTRAAVDDLSFRLWGGTRIFYVSGAFETSGLAGAVAWLDRTFAGALTWAREGDALRIVTIASVVEGQGVGRALLAAADAAARSGGAARLVVSTGNDNLRALAFYQRNGYVLAALHPGAIDRIRRLQKPSIPEIAANGIPIRDQIDLEKRLDGRRADGA